LTINIDGVEAGDEVDEDIVNTLWNFLQKTLCDLVVGWILFEINWNKEFLSLSVDITNVNTTLMSEVNPIALKRPKLVYMYNGRFKIGVATGAPEISIDRYFRHWMCFPSSDQTVKSRMHPDSVSLVMSVTLSMQFPARTQCSGACKKWLYIPHEPMAEVSFCNHQ
jgi:hypothetical protein